MCDYDLNVTWKNRNEIDSELMSQTLIAWSLRYVLLKVSKQGSDVRALDCPSLWRMEE